MTDSVPRCPPRGVIEPSDGDDANAGESRISVATRARVMTTTESRNKRMRLVMVGNPEKTYRRDRGDAQNQSPRSSAVSAVQRHGYASRSLITLPPSQISIGRLPGAISSLSALMPNWL